MDPASLTINASLPGEAGDVAARSAAQERLNASRYFEEFGKVRRDE